MNLGRRTVHQPYHGSLEIIHDPNHQVHHNPRVLDHVLLVIDYRKASQSNYYIITTGKLNADWSNKQYLQHNKSCNKAGGGISNSGASECPSLAVYGNKLHMTWEDNTLVIMKYFLAPKH